MPVAQKTRDHKIDAIRNRIKLINTLLLNAQDENDRSDDDQFNVVIQAMLDCAVKHLARLEDIVLQMEANG